jgi:CheY-like chemotaxis protein
VVHGIVRDHHGAIDVRTEEGLGTTFSVYFPAVSTNGVVEEDTEPTRGGGQRIMYVDDDTRVVFLMSRVMRKLGYVDSCFADPLQALEAFQAEPFAYSAVMTDMAMPKMNGVELAAALHAIRPDIPIALTSGYGADDQEFSGNKEFVAMLQKPASITETSRVLADLVSRTQRVTADR